MKPRPKTKNLWSVKLIILGAGLLLVCFAVDLFVRQTLYPGSVTSVPSPPGGIEELSIETSDGDKVVGWLRDHGNGPAVLFLHGNGENLAAVAWSGLFEQFHQAGVATLAIDYPGYGRSTGKPSQASLTAAGLAGFEALVKRFPDRPVFVVGFSLGAGTAMQIAPAIEDRSAGLVLLSPWHDLPSVAERFFPKILVRLALRDRYDSGESADKLKRPALVIHGLSDRIIPVDQGRRLMARLPEGSRFIELPGVDHNNLLSQEETWRQLASWLNGS